MSRPIVRDSSSLTASFLPRVISALTRPWVLALLWLVALVYAVRFALFTLPAPPKFTDFNHYYVAALSLRMGSNPYVTRFDALGRSLGLELSIFDIGNQPPTLLFCFEPLTRLSPYAAYWIWVGISLMSFVVALCALLRETSLDSRQALLFGALLFLYPPVYEHFYFSNMQIVITLLIVIAICCMGSGADRWAGLPLALATALKVYPAFLAIYLICRGRRRVLFWMVIWGGIIGVLTLWGVGRVSFFFVNTFGYTTSRRFLENPRLPFARLGGVAPVLASERTADPFHGHHEKSRDCGCGACAVRADAFGHRERQPGPWLARFFALGNGDDPVITHSGPSLSSPAGGALRSDR